ncbi:unnamed protein product [Auanema sp. JU1783]|nr:unnamed protein product [Auanema sp. JU1783]
MNILFATTNTVVHRTLLLFFIFFTTTVLSGKCPDDCECDELEKTVTCGGLLLLTLPDILPSGYHTLIMRNTSIRSVPKNSFRRMDELREVRFENSEQLDQIDKFAFKGMKYIRLISFSNCPRLHEICKGAFSGISNKQGLKIRFHETPIQRIHGGAFRHANNIRELSISGSDLALSRHAFASITQLDFLTLSGVVMVEPQLFTNSTRFHIIHIKESQFELTPETFEGLAHVHQLLIQRCKISRIASGAFDGLHTVETIELFDNQINSLAARAFTGVVNLGRLRIARNMIKSLETTESILSDAVQTRFEENTVDCGCHIKWMQAHPDRSLLDSNYCGSSGVYRSIHTFLRHHCENNYTSRSISTQASSRVDNGSINTKSNSQSMHHHYIILSMFYLIFVIC